MNERLDPQQFRQLAGGTLAQRGEALRLLIAHGLAEMKPDEKMTGEYVVHYLDPQHPCVCIYRDTRSRQGVT